jgi:hypothetical protein
VKGRPQDEIESEPQVSGGCKDIRAGPADRYPHLLLTYLPVQPGVSSSHCILLEAKRIARKACEEYQQNVEAFLAAKQAHISTSMEG